MKTQQYPVQKLARAFANGTRKDAEKILDKIQFDVNAPLNFGASSPLRPVSWTALIYACKNLNVDLVKLLLEKGADPAKDVNDGFSPIMAVTSAADRDQESGIKCAKLLIDAGLAITKVPMSHKRTLLTQAVHKNLTFLLAYFLEAGADPSERDGDGKTPLNLAVKQNSMEMVECLRKHEVNPFIQNLNGKSCLDIATDNDNDEMKAYLTSWRKSYYKEKFSQHKDKFRKMWEEVNVGCAMYTRKSGKKTAKVETLNDSGVDLSEYPKLPNPTSPIGRNHIIANTQQSPVPVIRQELLPDEMEPTPASPFNKGDNDKGDVLPLTQNVATALLRPGKESGIRCREEGSGSAFFGEEVTDMLSGPFPDEFISPESSPMDDVSMSFPSVSSSPSSAKNYSGKLANMGKPSGEGASFRHDLMLIAGTALAAIAMYHFLRKFKTSN